MTFYTYYDPMPLATARRFVQDPDTIRYTNQYLVYQYGRYLGTNHEIFDWNMARSHLKDNEVLVGHFSDDGGSNFTCPIINTESEFRHYQARFSPRTVAIVGLGHGGVGACDKGETPHPLVVKPLFYAMPKQKC